MKGLRYTAKRIQTRVEYLTEVRMQIWAFRAGRGACSGGGRDEGGAMAAVLTGQAEVVAVAVPASADLGTGQVSAVGM
jgi:hypothetical protein